MSQTLKILVVDDNATNRLVLVKVLEKEGYQVLEAVDGYEGVEMAQSSHPDLILLDVMMPGRDGFEVCRALKADEATSHVPIIFLSAKTEADDLDTAFAAGGCDYISFGFGADHAVASRRP